MNNQIPEYIPPNITNPDAGLVLVSKWKVENSDYQKLAGNAAADVWEHMTWPKGLLSHNVYLGNDGQTILQYFQWTGEEEVDAFMHKNSSKNGNTVSLKGLERIELTKYRYYRSLLSSNPVRRPDSIVIVGFETDGTERQEAFIDALFDVVKSRPNPHHPGSIASHFHLSTDGRRIMNYAEFTSEEAHEEMLQTQLRKDDDVPRLIRSMPGLKPLGFERFQLYKTVSRNLQDFGTLPFQRTLNSIQENNETIYCN